MFFRSVIFLLAAVISQSKAQTIEGRVTGAREEALPFVSVILNKDSQVVATGISDDSGHFRLTASLRQQQLYTLHFSLAGYKSRQIAVLYSDTLKPVNIVLAEDRQQLAEVTVTGKVNLITRKSDRYIINIENGPLANGLSGTEVLQRSPGIWVDNMGNIRLKGNQPVAIMINDVVQRMDAEELADFLRSLKSEDISRIEVIPNPPAEFEAGGSGGIIHIRLKKSKSNGWSGSANAQYWQQGQKPYTTVGATLNHQLRRLYLSGSYTYVRDLRSITERTIITYPDHSAFDNATDRGEKIGRHQYRFSSVYDLTAKQSVSIQSFFSKTRFHQLFQSDERYYNTVAASGKATSLKQRVFDMGSVTLNYSLKLDTSGSLLKIVADYLQTDRSETNAFAKLNPNPAKQRSWRNNAPTGTAIYTVQSDFAKALKPQTLFQSGLKYASLVRANELVTEDLTAAGWTINKGQSNHFMYTENILMLYTSLEHSVKHTTIKAGLRAEKTFSSGNETISATKFSRKYAGLFPSLSFMQVLDAESGASITAAYARRLTRPALNELNPARLEFSNYTAVTGNPNLLPQYSHHFSLSWQFLKHNNAEAYYVRTNQFIALSANAGANNSIDYLFENIGITAEYGVSYSSTIKPFAVWSITNNAAVYHAAYRFNGKPYRRTSFYAQTLHTINVANLAEFDFVADYRSPYIYTNLYTYGNFSMDAGITKKLLKSKARIRLSFTDILNTSREKEWTNESENSISFYRKRPTRTVRLSFTYQFSAGKKMQTKNIEQGGTDEKGRIGS